MTNFYCSYELMSQLPPVRHYTLDPTTATTGAQSNSLVFVTVSLNNRFISLQILFVKMCSV